jgi:hypothetical protein
MPITRSYTNAFEVVDYTQELALVPTKWSLLNDSGVFSEESVANNTVTFEEIGQTATIIGDQFRGAKPSANSDDSRKIHAYSLAHFPVVDAITPADIQGKRAYGSTDAAETEAAVMARKIARIARGFDDTLELARFKTLATLSAYTPNGTITASNFATDFGVTQKTVDFVLGTTTTDIVAKTEEVIAHIQDNSQGTNVSGVIGYASPEAFSKLIAHAKVQAAYQYYNAVSGQEILRNRAGDNMSMFRTFTYAGVKFIEVRGSIAGQRLVPANDIIFVPTGAEDMFITYYGPGNKMDLVNTLGEKRYLWTFRSPKGESVDIEGESNFINIVRRPALVVRGYTSN